jgi:hypothetical protein
MHKEFVEAALAIVGAALAMGIKFYLKISLTKKPSPAEVSKPAPKPDTPVSPTQELTGRATCSVCGRRVARFTIERGLVAICLNCKGK